MPQPIKVFISYSHQDEGLRNELVGHLSGLVQYEKLIEIWHDRKIPAGSNWEQNIDSHLEEADIILFLVSSDFIRSPYCQGVEVKHALKCDQDKTVRAIPIFVRPSLYESTPLRSLQGLPRNATPVSSSDRQTPSSRDGLWLEVVREIGQIAREIQDQILSAKRALLRADGIVAYAQKAELFYQDGDISPGEQVNLDFIAENYQLSALDIDEIWAKIKADYSQQQRALETYRETVRAEIKHRGGLTPEAQSVLGDLRENLGISDGFAGQIEQEVLEEQQRLEEQRQRELEQRRIEEHQRREFERKQLEEQQLEQKRQHEAEQQAVQKRNMEEQVRQEQATRLKEEQEQKPREGTTNKVHEFVLGSGDIQLQTFSFKVVLLDDKGKVKQRTTQSAQFFMEALAPSVDLEMVAIPTGSYLMGSLHSEGSSRERPQHRVQVPSFCLGKYPVTQAQWHSVAKLEQVKINLDSDPAHFKGDQKPIEQVSWNEAVEFCDRLSRKTGKIYRLPSEAEWEYACRAGTTTEFHFGNQLTRKYANCDVKEVATLIANLLRISTSDVGSFNVANSFGLFDMHGNVGEWCLDTFQESYKSAPTNGSAWIIKNDNLSRRLRRGGSWAYNPRACRSASRRSDTPGFRDDTVGFRVVCSAPRSLQ
ncbi:SUMF1/EgtB/PvdO family nonheme iron enzyme [Acaryochloris marina]|uniref:SUMF1/EgtB/PvdO family nonheme iron enzyme n=1 Tax=Acaryochloris marina TaxID=155978 RepID=UPI001BAF5189|nr:SUMF1/EgtB/PvdO family nonheme iron enzyme [Acaryochloris marina]QUY40967.1 SUMF1/EgtB/PvdO family nonheme iron enzyme [Acaryochloris marina S15]